MITSALRQAWGAWAELGSGLRAERWERPTRLDGWTVKDVYAHCCWAPWFFGEAAQQEHAPTGPVTHARASEVLAEMQASGGIAHTFADDIRQPAIDDADEHSTAELTEQFRTAGPHVLQQLEALDPSFAVDYGGMAVIPLGEARCASRCWKRWCTTSTSPRRSTSRVPDPSRALPWRRRWSCSPRSPTRWPSSTAPVLPVLR